MKIHFTDEDFFISSACPSGNPKCCVEVAHKNNLVAVRDTKDISKTMLTFTREEWQTFITGVKKGEFDF